MTKALADYDLDMFEKWRILIGDTNETTDPSKGIYAGGTNATGYPSVFRDPTTPTVAQTNRPSIFGQDIHVPLSFWFTEATTQALPLVGLQYHECEVQTHTQPDTAASYTYLDVSGFRVAPDYRMNSGTKDIRMNIPTYGQTTGPQRTNSQLFNRLGRDDARH
jgi:hypothetical protein